MNKEKSVRHRKHWPIRPPVAALRSDSQAPQDLLGDPSGRRTDQSERLICIGSPGYPETPVARGCPGPADAAANRSVPYDHTGRT